MKPITALKKTMRFFFHSMPQDSVLAMIYYLFDNLTPTVTTILFARLFGQVYLYLSGGVGVRGMAVNAGILVGFYLLKELVGFLSSTAINAGVYEKSMHLLKDALVAKSAGLPLACLEDRKVLDMRKRAEECVDNDRLPGIYMLTNMLITSVIGIVSLIVTLSVYHWMLAVTAVISVSQFCISTYLVEKAVYRANAQLTEDKRKRDYVWELYTDPKAVKEMRLMGFGGYLSAKWRAYRDDVNERLWSLEEKGYRYKAVCEGIKTFGYLLGVALTLGLMQRGMITVGVFGAALTAFISVQDAIGSFFESVGRIPNFLKYAADYFTYVEMEVPEEGQEPCRGLKEEIVFENVSFRYPNGQSPVLQNVSFCLKKGQVLSLVGVNGSGKTTLIKLLLGIYPALEGRVLYDGHPVETLNKKALYRHVALLSQDFSLYPLTMEENIALLNLDTLGEKDRFSSALEEVGMKEAVADISPDEIAGKQFGGREFSEGQKQRLALARVLYADRELVILDEPTSALDPLAENEILEEFLRVAKGRTVVIVSHRVGLCRKADVIAVMSEGRLAEFGSHAELIARNGEYARLYYMQSRWYEEGALS